MGYILYWFYCIVSRVSPALTSASGGKKLFLLWLRHCGWILKCIALVPTMSNQHGHMSDQIDIFQLSFSPWYQSGRTWELRDCNSVVVRDVECCHAVMHQPPTTHPCLVPGEDSSMLSRSPATLCLSVCVQLCSAQIPISLSYVLTSQLPGAGLAWPALSALII